jgi:hypothetical protein
MRALEAARTRTGIAWVPAPLAPTAGRVLGYTSRTGKFATLAGGPAYTVAYHATGVDVVFG